MEKDKPRRMLLRNLSFSVSKITVALFVWAVAATTLLCARIYSGSNPDPVPCLLRSSSLSCPYVWHGGSPTHNGSCWCGSDDYCMCTPSLAIDAIIEVESTQSQTTNIVLIRRRRNTYAIVGGFVNVGETVENTVRREVKEETNLEVGSVELFAVYSDPLRDLRRHTVSLVYKCKVNSLAGMQSGDDARGVEVVPLMTVSELNLAFDHRQILKDYISKYHNK